MTKKELSAEEEANEIVDRLKNPEIYNWMRDFSDFLEKHNTATNYILKQRHEELCREATEQKNVQEMTKPMKSSED